MDFTRFIAAVLLAYVSFKLGEMHMLWLMCRDDREDE